MYKRFIIYLYYYKKKDKKENCGYAKINIQNEECRIEVNIKNIPQMEGPEILYLLKKERDGWKKKQILQTQAEQGVINLRHVYRFNEVTEEFSTDEIQGILVYDGNNIQKAVCGALNGEEINLSEIQEMEKEVLKTKGSSQNHMEESAKEGKDSEESASEGKENKAALETIEISQNSTKESTKERKENKEALEMTEISQNQLKESAKENSDTSENSVYEYDEECLKKKAENEGADCLEEMKIESCCTGLNDKENIQMISTDTWQEKMFRVFPKVILNINGEKTSAIKLKPHDIVWFPGAYWRLASNKFLLNGYYNYRYILFFKGSGENEGRYFLGTPGYFGVSDAMTAKKFGFTDFFMADNIFAGNEGRNFGFWCRET